MAALRHQPTRADLEREVAQLASTQYGVIGGAQALSLGLSEAAIKASLQSGRWEKEHRGVYVVGGSPKTWYQSLMSVCLLGGEGTFASHRSAARLLGLAGFENVVIIEISTRRNLRRLPENITAHKVVQPWSGDIVSVRSVPSTDPARTLVDLAAVVEVEVLEVALDDALRRRLVTIPRLRWRIRTIGVKGKRGTAVLRTLLEERRSGTSPAESPLETRLVRLLAHAKLPPPVKQFEIRDKGNFVARVDLAYPLQRIAIEAHSYQFHSDRIAWERDAERRNALEALGWRVLNVTARQIEHGPERVVERIRKMLSD